MNQPNDNTLCALQDAVLSIDRLPPLRMATTRLIEIAADPEVDIDELAAVIEQDPPLTLRILSLANSAFYGEKQAIVSVRQAIIRVLGLDMVRSLSLAMALTGSFNTRHCPEFDVANYWLCSLATANVAAAIGRRLRGHMWQSIHTLHLCGMLHDIGVLALVHLRPSEMSTILSKTNTGSGHEAAGLERELIGTDRWQVGEWLAYRWQLPAVVVRSFGRSQVPSVTDQYAEQIEIVVAASRWIDNYLYGSVQHLELESLSAEDVSVVEKYVANHFDQWKALAAGFR